MLKLRPRTFQIYWDAHAWAGVVGSFLLYVMFFMGAFALFHRELTLWADPEGVQTSLPPAPGAALPALQPLLEQLDREQPLAGKDRVAFMPEASGLRAYWRQGAEDHEFRFAASTQRLEPLRSELGSFLYEMHYLGPLPKGIYVAGVASMALLLALVSGLLIHLKDLLRQWFQFRPERVTRTWSSDMHKVLGVFGLPYQLLYAWSGAVLCFSYILVEPLFVATTFGGDERAARIVRGDTVTAPEATGVSTEPLPNLDALLAQARREVPKLSPSWIGIEHVGDTGSTVSVYGEVAGVSFGTADVLFRAVDGAVLAVNGPSASAFSRFEAWFYGLHYARFGGYGIKVLYALLALASCVVIFTGNLIWLERRDRRRAHPGNRWLERATAGWCAGLPLATAALFLFNRLLPALATLEQAVFWIVWGLSLVPPFLWRSSRQVAGVEFLLAGATLVAAVGIELGTRGHSLSDPLQRGVSGGLLALALGCSVCGVRLLRPRPAPQRAAMREPLLLHAD
ncbi:MAG TPA: PepSY-associated TM helix domain-containing protein [Polyangiaceae bacterium]|nr:PepSY-associated TM helix domain-containing protein [Polyangiaceae bacterium]